MPSAANGSTRPSHPASLTPSFNSPPTNTLYASESLNNSTSSTSSKATIPAPSPALSDSSSGSSTCLANAPTQKPAPPDPPMDPPNRLPLNPRVAALASSAGASSVKRFPSIRAIFGADSSTASSKPAAALRRRLRKNNLRTQHPPPNDRPEQNTLRESQQTLKPTPSCASSIMSAAGPPKLDDAIIAVSAMDDFSNYTYNDGSDDGITTTTTLTKQTLPAAAPTSRPPSQSIPTVAVSSSTAPGPSPQQQKPPQSIVLIPAPTPTLPEHSCFAPAATSATSSPNMSTSSPPKRVSRPPPPAALSISGNATGHTSSLSSASSSSSSTTATTPISTYYTSSSSPSSFYFSSSSSSSSVSSSYASSFTSPSQLLRGNGTPNTGPHSHHHGHHHGHHGNHRHHRTKDPFHDRFKTLDSDYSRFCSKTGVYKANVLRLSLLSFLRQQCGDQHAASTAATLQNQKPSARPSSSPALESPANDSPRGLAPEDVAKRLKIFHKWWNGLLNALKDKDKPVSGSDRSAYLEAISGIVARSEWVLTYNDDATATDKSTLLNSYRLIFETLLCETLSWVLNKLSLKTVPISMAAFAGKVIAYAFFYSPGVAAPLLYLLRVPPLAVDRILRVSFALPDDDLTNNGSPINPPSSAYDLDVLAEAASSMRPFFPQHVSNLVGFTYHKISGAAAHDFNGKSGETASSYSVSGPKSATPDAPTTSSALPKTRSKPFRAFHKQTQPSQHSYASTRQHQPFPQENPVPKSLCTNVFASKPPTPALVPDIYGPWVRRWTCFNSDVFFSFLKHYYTIVSAIYAASPMCPLNRQCPRQPLGSGGLSTPTNMATARTVAAASSASVLHMTAPGLIVLHAFILTGLDAVIRPPQRKSVSLSSLLSLSSSSPLAFASGNPSHLRLSLMTNALRSGAANTNGATLPPDFLTDSYAVNIAPVSAGMGRRRVDQLKLLAVIREILHNDESCTPFFEPYCIQLERILHASAYRTSLYDIDSCVVLCDLVEEFLSSLVLSSSVRTRHRISIQKDNAVDWAFWITVVQRMLSSENSNTELRALAFLFNVWDQIPIAASSSGRSGKLFPQDRSTQQKTSASIFDLYFDEQESLRWNCTAWLLSPQMWMRYFCHWHPLVRSYYLRLLCWRVASVGPGPEHSGFLTSVIFSNHNADARALLEQRLSYTWTRFGELVEVCVATNKPIPSTAPCLPVMHRQLKIVHNPAAMAASPPMAGGGSSTSIPVSVLMLQHARGRNMGRAFYQQLQQYQQQQQQQQQQANETAKANAHTPRRIDPYEVFDEVAYSYPTSSQTPDLLPAKAGQGLAGGSSVLRNNRSSLTSTISNTSTHTGDLGSKRYSTGRFESQTSSPLNRKNRNANSTPSLLNMATAEDYNASKTPGAAQQSFGSSIRKKWDSFKTGSGSNLRRYFGKNSINGSSGPAGLAVQVEQPKISPNRCDTAGLDVITDATLGRAAYLNQVAPALTASPALAPPRSLGSLKEAAVTSANLGQPVLAALGGSGGQSPALSFSSFDNLEVSELELLPPPHAPFSSRALGGASTPSSAASSPTLSPISLSPSLVSTPTHGPSTPVLHHTAGPGDYSPSLSAESSTFSNSFTPISSLSSASTPPSPGSLLQKRHSNGDKLAASTLAGGNGGLFATSVGSPHGRPRMEHPLPPLPANAQPHSQPRTNGTSTPQQGLSRAGSRLLSRTSSTLGRSGSSGLLSRSQTITSNNSDPAMSTPNSSNSAASLTMTLIPPPPQILRKRPEIVRPRYKFGLEFSEESLRKQQELLHTKRSQLYSHHFGSPSAPGAVAQQLTPPQFQVHEQDYYYFHNNRFLNFASSSKPTTPRVVRPKLPFDGDLDAFADEGEDDTTGYSIGESPMEMNICLSMRINARLGPMAGHASGLGLSPEALELVKYLQRQAQRTQNRYTNMFRPTAASVPQTISIVRSVSPRPITPSEKFGLDSLGSATLEPTPSSVSSYCTCSEGTSSAGSHSTQASPIYASFGDCPMEMGNLRTATSMLFKHYNNRQNQQASFASSKRNLSKILGLYDNEGLEEDSNNVTLDPKMPVSVNSPKTATENLGPASPQLSLSLTSPDLSDILSHYGDDNSSGANSPVVDNPSETASPVVSERTTTIKTHAGYRLQQQDLAADRNSGSFSNGSGSTTTHASMELGERKYDALGIRQMPPQLGSSSNGPPGRIDLGSLVQAPFPQSTISTPATLTTSALASPFLGAGPGATAGAYPGFPFEHSPSTYTDSEGSSFDEDDEDDKLREDLREFEHTSLRRGDARARAKIADNDKYWKYAGRALNEWALVVREFQDFVKMRRTVYGAGRLEELDVPFMIAEIPAKALVG